MTSDTVFTATGHWRVYFNRHGAAPLVWCVAPQIAGPDAGWELTVADVMLSGFAATVYQRPTTPDDDGNRPSAWIAITGKLTVHSDGRAVIEAT